eukprot:CAMPEP_0202368328 /NCGR_PEP_ID=MMETSP1127-20130417/461_1 /ASSEMBLY_ACC=CAM_ASM_000462 /TAXON_ID=3047 /ORGANISM="Dunaliella tertiolecta, Strain CCMP1320" /LENGTH=644 /DNA_ID=CAMNT_0048963735 /DNA_START=160 /DNA_END=2095 /DNA_ORIENTATION=+
MADTQKLMIDPSIAPKPLVGGVTLPSLSPLAGRKVKPTLAVHDLKEGLNTFGYEVGWDDGNLQVTPPSCAQSLTSAPATFSIETFLGGLHRDRNLGLGRSGRPRMASSVTFTTAKSQPSSWSSKPGPQHQASFSTPNSPVFRKPHHTSPSPQDPPTTPPGTSRFAHAQAAAAAAASGSAPAPASSRPFTAPNQPYQQHKTAPSSSEGTKAGVGASGGGQLAPAAAGAGSPSPQVATTLVHSSAGHNGSSRQGITAADTSPTLPRGNHGSNGPARFHRLARSVDSLQSLRVNNRGGLNAANLQALSEPQWAPSFNSTSPLIPQGPLLDSQQLNATQQHLEQQGHGYSGQQGAGEFEEEDEARRGDGGGEGEWGPNGSWIPSSEAADGVGHLPQQQQQYHPRMATSMPLHVQDIHDGAAASLAASKQAAANGEVHTAQRPFTARIPTNIGPRSRTGHPMANFKPSRGQALQVFQHLDKDKNGKVTLAELEEAGLSLGFSLEQTHRLFKRMDKGNKGYLKAADWGDQEFVKVLEFFSLMYMQKYMGLPTQASTPEQVGKYFASQELRQIKTVPAAISMARTNAVMRAINAANYNDFILDCFKFVDTEQRGSLGVEGLRDGFAALGVQLTDEVAKQIMGDMAQMPMAI